MGQIQPTGNQPSSGQIQPATAGIYVARIQPTGNQPSSGQIQLATAGIYCMQVRSSQLGINLAQGRFNPQPQVSTVCRSDPANWEST
jgi:hypothetical protein